MRQMGVYVLLDECPIKPGHIDRENVHSRTDPDLTESLQGVVGICQAISADEWFPFTRQEYAEWCEGRRHFRASIDVLLQKSLLVAHDFSKICVTRELVEQAFHSAPASDALPHCYPQLMLDFLA